MSKSNKFSPEVRERAVRMVQEHRGEYTSLWAATESIAPKIGCTGQTLNEWVKRHETDHGQRGAITDATIIPSAAWPRQHVEMPDDDDDDGGSQVIDSADTDASWTKKGNKAYYGYRGYAAVDGEDGYVEHVKMHPANESEVKKLEGLLDELPPEADAVLADKGYASANNRAALAKRGLGDLIQYKGHKNKPLSDWQTKMNKAIGGLRFKVEQAFGTMNRRFHLARARYFGVAKTQAQMCWATLGMNLLKAHRELFCRERCLLIAARCCKKQHLRPRGGGTHPSNETEVLKSAISAATHASAVQLCGGL